MQPGTRYPLEVNPKIPKRLARLEELAANLWYSWDRPTRAIFARLNPALWDAVGHNPKAMLKRIDEQRLIDAASDPAFLDWPTRAIFARLNPALGDSVGHNPKAMLKRIDEQRLINAASDPAFLDSLTRVLAAFNAYLAEPPFRNHAGQVKGDELIAYFCAEFGVHESLPLYSGGLGILAGDHCKAASDFKLPFVAVGLLYRQGYFVQTIDAEGRQRAEYHDSEFTDLPIEPVKKDGSELVVALDFPGRKLSVKVWQSRIGHVRLFMLDTDLPENTERDRAIAHRLYGGDRTTRLEQELVLGVG